MGSMIPIAASAAQTSSGRPSAAKAGLGARGGREKGGGGEGATACEFSSSAASSVADGDAATVVGDRVPALDRPRDGAERWPRLSMKRSRIGGCDRLRDGGGRRDWLGGGGIRRDGDADEAAAAALAVEARCRLCPADLIWIAAVALFEEEKEEYKDESSSSEARRRRRMQQLIFFRRWRLGGVEVDVRRREEVRTPFFSVHRRKKK